MLKGSEGMGIFAINTMGCDIFWFTYPWKLLWLRQYDFYSTCEVAVFKNTTWSPGPCKEVKHTPPLLGIIALCPK
jgi:hypothetical protein